MSLAEILLTIQGVFKFWDEVTWLIKTLQKTPEEKRIEIMGEVKKKADEYEATGRPTWG